MLGVLAVHVSASFRVSLVWPRSVCASESCGLFGSLGMMCDLGCNAATCLEVMHNEVGFVIPAITLLCLRWETGQRIVQMLAAV